MSSLQRLGVLLGLFVYVALIRGQTETDDCQCMAYYLCSSGTIKTMGRSNTGESRCRSSIEVCCKLSDIISPVALTTPEPASTKPRCGRRNPDGVGFTLDVEVDGEANFGEFPWMVALLREEKAVGSTQVLTNYVCGGALIHPRVVLTAAHAIYAYREQVNSLKIRAGEWDSLTTNEHLLHQERGVSEMIIHEGYVHDKLLNDIALLILQEPVIPAEHIDFVCLPSQGQNFDFSNCFSNGWGKYLFGREGQNPNILKKVELPIVPSRPTCQNTLRKARLGPDFMLHESFICAGGNGTVDTCTKADIGSPLVCPIASNPEHYQQAGIVAWGLGCGEREAPTVYVNVALFKNWIDQKMTTNNFTTSYYTYENELPQTQLE